MCFAILTGSIVTGLISVFPTNWQKFDEIVVAHLNVQIGDIYEGGKFYRNGEYVKTPEEENYDLLVADMQSALSKLGVEI